MYKSPIEIITESMQTDLENQILSSVLKTDVSVDKEELIKALNYDRDQYQKGYADGKAEALSAVKAELISMNSFAIERIRHQLDNGYLDMTDDYDKEEIEILRDSVKAYEAIEILRSVILKGE